MENFIKIEIERISGEKILKVLCKKNYIFNVFFENGTFGILNFIDKTVSDVFVYENEDEFNKGSKEIKIFRNKYDIKNQKDFIGFGDNIFRKDNVLAFKINVLNEKETFKYEITNMICLKNDDENYYIFSTEFEHKFSEKNNISKFTFNENKDSKEFNLNNKNTIEELKNSSDKFQTLINNTSDLLLLAEDYDFIKFGDVYINKKEILNIELEYIEKNILSNEISFGNRVFFNNKTECFIYLNTLNIKDIKKIYNDKNGEISIIDILISFYNKIFKNYSIYELEETLKFKEPEEYQKYIELKKLLKNLI